MGTGWDVVMTEWGRNGDVLGIGIMIGMDTDGKDDRGNRDKTG